MPFSEEASPLPVQAQIVSNPVQFPEEDWKDISQSAKVVFVFSFSLSYFSHLIFCLSTITTKRQSPIQMHLHFGRI
jgi:hypothetical protein